jgi:hypothetical protein
MHHERHSQISWRSRWRLLRRPGVNLATQSASSVTLLEPRTPLSCRSMIALRCRRAHCRHSSRLTATVSPIPGMSILDSQAVLIWRSHRSLDRQARGMFFHERFNLVEITLAPCPPPGRSLTHSHCSGKSPIVFTTPSRYCTCRKRWDRPVSAPSLRTSDAGARRSEWGRSTFARYAVKWQTPCGSLIDDNLLSTMLAEAETLEDIVIAEGIPGFYDFDGKRVFQPRKKVHLWFEMVGPMVSSQRDCFLKGLFSLSSRLHVYRNLSRLEISGLSGLAFRGVCQAPRSIAIGNRDYHPGES